MGGGGGGGEQLNKNKSVCLVCLFLFWFGLLVFGFAVVVVACLLLLLALFVCLFFGVEVGCGALNIVNEIMSVSLTQRNCSLYSSNLHSDEQGTRHIVDGSNTTAEQQHTRSSQFSWFCWQKTTTTKQSSQSSWFCWQKPTIVTVLLKKKKKKMSITDSQQPSAIYFTYVCVELCIC